MKPVNKPNLGRQPLGPLIKSSLAAFVQKREPDELVIVHHYTDTRTKLQLEVERRSSTLGLSFERIVL
jgi:hypothetical protein